MMGKEDFLRSVIKRYYASLHATQSDNYDWDRFPTDSFPDNSRVFDADCQAEYMCFFIRNYDRIFSTFIGLRDETSQELFVRLILFRLLGHLHIRILPGVTFSKERELIDKAKTFYAGPSFLSVQSDWGPLEHFEGMSFSGESLKLDTWPGNIVSCFIKKQYYFCRDGVHIHPTTGDTVIDAGACIGDTAVAFACSVGEEGKVFAFDPFPAHISMTQHNVSQNGLSDRVSLVPYAVGAQTRILHAKISSDERILPGFSVIGKEGHVSTISIDDFCFREKLEKIDFIKMDIEGYELPALIGAKKIILRDRPKLAISLYHKDEDFVSIPDYLSNNFPFYDMYLDHYTIYKEETVLYASCSQ